MRPLYFFLFIGSMLILVSCKTDNPNSEDGENLVAEHDSLLCLHEITGNYIGEFGESSIRIEITYANDHKVIGYNVLRGLQRNLSGNVVFENNVIQLILNEPGDHENDGKFTLFMNPETCEINGEWHSNSGKIPSRTFKLSKVILNDQYEPPYTVENLTNITRFLTGEYGDLEFQENGRVMYTFFQERDDVSHEEKTMLFGNWSMAKDKVLIEWQQNTVFKKPKMYFTIIQDEYENLEIRCDTLVFYNRMF